MFKRLRRQKEALKEEIRQLTIKQRILKYECCDFCMDEVMQGTMKMSDARVPLYGIKLPCYSLRMCKQHARELSMILNEELKTEANSVKEVKEVTK